MSSTEIAQQLEPLADRIEQARLLAAADLLPTAYRNKPANLLLAIEYGHALGVPLTTVLSGVHVIDGKPTASASLLASLVRRAGHRLRITGDATQATAELTRRDDPDFTFRATWTIERAAQAGLAGRGSWAKYPDAMLKARALTEVIRDAAPEVGILYTAEEIGHDFPQPSEPSGWLNAATGELRPQPPVEVAEHIEIVEAEIVEIEPQKMTRKRKTAPEPEQDPWATPEPDVPASEPEAQLEPEPEPEQPGKGRLAMVEPVTMAQSGRMGGLIRAIGLTQAEALDVARQASGRPDLASARQLDKAEASRVITALTAMLPSDPE